MAGEQEAVFRGDGGGDGLGVDVVAGGAQFGDAGDVDGEGGVEPAGEAAEVALGGGLAAGQDDDFGAGVEGGVDDVVGEAAAGVARHDDVAWIDGHATELALLELDALGEAGPGAAQAVGDASGAFGQVEVDGQRGLRAVVEEQHELRDQGVTAGQVDDAAAAKAATGTARDLPGLVQLLARYAAGFAQVSGDAVEQSGPRKSRQVVASETRTAAGVEAHAPKASSEAVAWRFAPRRGD